jgi:hypothetical protein
MNGGRGAGCRKTVGASCGGGEPHSHDLGLQELHPKYSVSWRRRKIPKAELWQGTRFTFGSNTTSLIGLEGNSEERRQTQ